jgi:hypothetical protein
MKDELRRESADAALALGILTIRLLKDVAIFGLLRCTLWAVHAMAGKIPVSGRVAETMLVMHALLTITVYVALGIIASWDIIEVARGYRGRR